ncbi:hypothetical protein SPHINGOR109_30170 [Sphingorhabdus sp. 109]|nr:hypothetical protein SPHINGOR109_30170 [Sphingorhabdus sp. 109]
MAGYRSIRKTIALRSACPIRNSGFPWPTAASTGPIRGEKRAASDEPRRAADQQKMIHLSFMLPTEIRGYNQKQDEERQSGFPPVT